MKDLPETVMDWLNTSPIEPLFLIEIELDETLYLSTRQRYEYAGRVYEPGLVQGLVVGQEQATFGLINENYRHTTPALTGQYQRAPVSVWWTEGFDAPQLLIDAGYVEDDYYETEWRSDPLLIFQGEISQFDQISSVLGVMATRMASRRFPAIQVYPPIANFVTPAGTTIRVGDTTFTLQPRYD